ncbi:MAG: hypothetical protein SchgKO_03080 [Schleiferiaceae bacterium]
MLSWGIQATTITVTTTNATGPGSLGAAISSASSNDTITFATSLLDSGNAVITGNVAYTVTKSLTILGVDSAGHRVVIDGQNLYRVFTVNIPGTSVSRFFRLVNVDVKQATTPSAMDGSGGAIKLISVYDVELRDCAFYNNFTHIGGSVLSGVSFTTTVIPQTLLVVNCEFYGNSDGQNNARDGSIELFNTGDVEVRNCYFHNNLNANISVDGGDELKVIHCQFENNGDEVLSKMGTGVYAEDFNRVAVDSCDFTNNYSWGSGSCVSTANNSVLLIRHSSFIDNKAGIQAGVIRDVNGSYDITRIVNCILRNNESVNSGAIEVGKAGIFSSIIRSNSATNHAGAIRATSDLLIKNCSIDSNSAGMDGGAIYSEGVLFELLQSSVTYNTSASEGGAIIRTDNIPKNYETRIRESTIANNQGQNGGFMYQRDGYIEIWNSTIVNNVATSWGDFLNYGSLDSLKIRSSIVLGHTNYSKLFTRSPFPGSYTPGVNFPLVSNGYNILQQSFPVNSQFTDIMNATASDANLGLLSNNGRVGLTMVPQLGSKAVNSGTPFDMRNAQNDSILDGLRDRGAAESNLQTNYVIERVYACDSLLVDTQWVATSGTYEATYVNEHGVDSTHVYKALINSTVTSTEVIQSCAPFTWIDGQTYSSDTSGVGITYTSSTGCDSIHYLNYTRLVTADSTTVAVQSCNPFMWIDSVTYSSDTLTDWITFSNQWQCDSLVRLDFDHLPESDTTVIDTAFCNPITWGNGITLSGDTTVYAIETNIFGCDSVVQLNFERTVFQDSAFYQPPVLRTSVNTGVITWYKCAPNWVALSSFGDTNAITPTTNGCYAAVVVDGLCHDTTNQVMVTGISVQEEAWSNFAVYPNPSTGEITIAGTSNEKFQVLIMDLSGRVIDEKSEFKLGSKLTLPTSSGLYLISIISENQGVHTVKVKVVH